MGDVNSAGWGGKVTSQKTVADAAEPLQMPTGPHCTGTQSEYGGDHTEEEPAE